MTDEKKTIVSLKIERKPIDSDSLFRDQDALKKHMNLVAALDANQAQNNPDKPATRVSSLDSFLTSSSQTSLSLKRSESSSLPTDAKVTVFAKPEAKKSRKK